MRILQVNTFDMAGGAEGSAWNLHQSYRRRGHASWLAVGRKRRNDPDVFLIPNEQCRPAWTRFWRRASDRLSAGPIPHLARLASLMANLQRGRQWMESRLGREDFDWPGTRYLLGLPPERPHIVHCHNLHRNYFDLRALPQLSAQVPVILNLRDAWLLSGHCAHSFACERWKTGCGECPDLTIYPAIPRDATRFNWQRKRAIFSRSRLYLTTVSDWLRRQVRDSMLNGVSCQVIPNGIDLTVFHPANKGAARGALGVPPQSKVVLYAANGGRNSPWRDFAQLERALLSLVHPEVEGLTLICVGGKVDSEERLSERLAVRYQRFEQDPERMALFYQAADVYALPALAEAFGKTVTEAMACGTPVVATAVGGITEQIRNGITGFFVPMSDVDAMASAIERLLVSESLRNTMGEAAADHARRHFGLERQVDRFLSYYAEVRADWMEWSAGGLPIQR